MGTLAVVLQILLLLVGMFMILIVLLQRGRGGGLAGAFGGMGGQSAFGTKAGDVFTRITVVVAAIWVVLAGVSGVAMRKSANTYAEELPNGVESLEADGDEGTSGSGAGTIPPLGGESEQSDIPATPPVSTPPAGTTPPLSAPDTKAPGAPAQTPESSKGSESGAPTGTPQSSATTPETSATPPGTQEGEKNESAPAPSNGSTPPAEGANPANPDSSGS